MIVVRPAREADVPEMSRVLTDSIVELCSPDHGNDPAVIEGWTRNKSEDGVRAMLSNPANALLVATESNVLLAVGCIVDGDSVGLNYVDPRYRFRGASSALLADMEARIKAAGHSAAQLTSTATARAFYLARGWQETDPGAPRIGYPMRKIF